MRLQAVHRARLVLSSWPSRCKRASVARVVGGGAGGLWLTLPAGRAAPTSQVPVFSVLVSLPRLLLLMTVLCFPFVSLTDTLQVAIQNTVDNLGNYFVDEHDHVKFDHDDERHHGWQINHHVRLQLTPTMCRTTCAPSLLLVHGGRNLEARGPSARVGPHHGPQGHRPLTSTRPTSWRWPRPCARTTRSSKPTPHS